MGHGMSSPMARPYFNGASCDMMASMGFILLWDVQRSHSHGVACHNAFEGTSHRTFYIAWVNIDPMDQPMGYVVGHLRRGWVVQ